MRKPIVGTKIYFKLHKAKLAKSGIVDLTPDKLYTIVSLDHHFPDTLGYIFDDVGDSRIVKLDDPACLYKLTNWIVKRQEV